jgi:hypothetical protein
MFIVPVRDVRFTPKSRHSSGSHVSPQSRTSRNISHKPIELGICKTDQIRTAWATRDRIGALRVAARFFDRSEDTRAFKRGMDANNHPGFYRQIGQEPQELVAAALEILARRFDLR